MGSKLCNCNNDLPQNKYETSIVNFNINKNSYLQFQKTNHLFQVKY
jgi:hypothetical protein